MAGTRGSIPVSTDRLQRQLDEVSGAIAEGRVRRAMALAGKVCEAAPDQPAAWVALGYSAMLAGDFIAARDAYARADDLRPGDAQLLAAFGVAAASAGDAELAVTKLSQAARLAPDDKSVWINLGNAISQASAGKDPARTAFGRALALDAASVEARVSYAHALALVGELDDARLLLAEGHARDPGNADIALGLVGILDDLQQRDRAAAVLEGASHPRLRQSRLMRLNYDDAIPAETLARLHFEFGAALAPAKTGEFGRRLPEAGKALRVALVSPDFRDHPIASFVRPLLAGADPARLRIHLYSDTPKSDPSTAALRAAAGGAWREIWGESGEQVARHLANDRIDVAIDLAGHTDSNRMRDFAGRLAPWQATWLGYPNTTGVPAIDFRLVDATTDPAGRAEALNSERLVRVEGCFVCYGAPHDVALCAARAAGHPVTFGSANNFKKIGPATGRLWARVLAAVPGARLLLKSSHLFDGAQARRAAADYLATHGIDPARVEFRAHAPGAAGHLRFYDEVDVALDPLNYNGTTTTCDALWMGVPVVALAGDRHAARVGASLLAAAGLPSFVATDADGYVALAARLAGDVDGLFAGRAERRARMAASRLTDANAFAAAWESALRGAIAAQFGA